MKATDLNRLCIALVAGAALLGAPARSQAQTLTTSWTNTFDSGSGSVNSTTSWCWWYDLEQHPGYGHGYNDVITNSFDTSYNSTLSPPPTSTNGSGSLHWVTVWPGVPENTTEGGQTLIYGTFGGGSQYDTSHTIDASKYDSVSFDLYVDPNSPLNSAGHVCSLTVLFFIANYSTYTITNVIIPTNNFGKWVRYLAPINKATAPAPPASLPAGFGFNINCYGGENASLFTNTTATVLWIDNIYLKLSTVVSPPPTMTTITQPNPGLNLFSGGPFTDQYQRNSIKLQQTTGVGFLGQQGVSYSFTITNFPNGFSNDFPGYQAHIFVTSGPGTATALDYNETNVIWLNVQQNNDLTANAYFRYKINEPNNNSNMFGAEYIGTASAGTLTNLHATTPLGTWGMTFNNNTNVTLFGPGGASLTFVFSNAAALDINSNFYFAEPLNVVFGAQPNQTNNVGQEVILTEASVTNAGTSTSIVDDHFLQDATLDTTTTWTILTGEPNTIFLFPVDPGQRLVSWTTPDVGYGLQDATNNLARSNVWTTLTGADSVAVLPPLSVFNLHQGFRTTLVPSIYLDPNKSYFRLLQQSYVQLQVLMEGESPAPGTPTGKTGSPIVQSNTIPFSVTVNAVDNNWYLINTVTDTIHITSSDGTATLPPDAALAGGTGSFLVTFGTNGTWTVTASDVTDNTKASNTGSPTPTD